MGGRGGQGRCGGDQAQHGEEVGGLEDRGLHELCGVEDRGPPEVRPVLRQVEGRGHRPGTGEGWLVEDGVGELEDEM